MSVRSFVAKWFRDSGRRKAVPVRRPLPFRPALESLEDRLTPATGNLTTSLVGGNLTIIDNAATSQITISQPAANEITITPDAGTTVNGKAGPVTITGVSGNLAVNLSTGRDSLIFDLSQHSIDVGNLSITGTTGAKTVLTNTAGTTNTLDVHGNYKEIFGDGNEFTRLNQFNITGNLTIDHANGNSFVFLGVDPANLGTQFNHVAGDLTVANVAASGGPASGLDVNALEETNVGGDITSNMGLADRSGDASNGQGGWTSVGSQSNQSVIIGGDVTITAQTGLLAFGDFANDGEEVRNALVAGDVTMKLGSGVGNTALFGGGTSATSTTAHSVTITGGGSHDTVTVAASTIQDDLAVSLTGAGGSAITVDRVSVGDETSLKTAGGSSSIVIDNQAAGSTFSGPVDIAMTGSNNLLEINSHVRRGQTGTTTFDGKVSATLGAGNDTLVLAEIGKVDFEAAATFNGGTGMNHALVNDGNFVGTTPKLVHFS
jgi:hypothetical protein